MYKIFHGKLKRTFLKRMIFIKIYGQLRVSFNAVQVIMHNVTDMTHYMVLRRELEQLTRHIPTMTLLIIELSHGVTQVI